MMLKKKLTTIVLAAPIIYLTTCSYVAFDRERAYEFVKVGDSEQDVIAAFGSPSHREKPGSPFFRYATKSCEMPCVERLWFENRLAFDIEAWSIELNEQRRVIKKTHWTSP